METEHELIMRMRKDVAIAAETLQPREARYLVDTYYQVQEHRIAIEGQIRSMTNGAKEPHLVLSYLLEQMQTLENQVKRALDIWTRKYPPSVWARDVRGIGPVIAAGLRAHIDVTQAPTVGHVWRFAGLDPTQQWLGTEKARVLVRELTSSGLSAHDAVAPAAASVGCRPEALMRLATTDKDGTTHKLTVDTLIRACAKRPWNAGLKVLAWKIGESFVKAGGYYREVYDTRKAMEAERNEAGGYESQARGALEKKRYGKETVARKAYEQGKLPPGHIHARARRYAVKLFLAHYWETLYRHEIGSEPPLPYPIARIPGHSHYVGPEDSQDFRENHKVGA